MNDPISPFNDLRKTNETSRKLRQRAHEIRKERFELPPKIELVKIPGDSPALTALQAVKHYFRLR